MADVIEIEPFPEDAEKLLHAILHILTGKNVETGVNALANALVIVTQHAGGELAGLRKYLNDMIDAHEAMQRQHGQP